MISALRCGVGLPSGVGFLGPRVYAGPNPPHNATSLSRTSTLATFPSPMYKGPHLPNSPPTAGSSHFLILAILMAQSYLVILVCIFQGLAGASFMHLLALWSFPLGDSLCRHWLLFPCVSGLSLVLQEHLYCRY